MNDPCITPGTISDRLRRLLARRRAWAKLDWGPISCIPSPGECSAYEVIDGQFVKMLWGKEITVLNLPSVSTMASLEHKDDIDGVIKDFAMDPSQDLIAYLEDDASCVVSFPSSDAMQTPSDRLRSRTPANSPCTSGLYPQISPIPRQSTPYCPSRYTQTIRGQIFSGLLRYNSWKIPLSCSSVILSSAPGSWSGTGRMVKNLPCVPSYLLYPLPEIPRISMPTGRTVPSTLASSTAALSSCPARLDQAAAYLSCESRARMTFAGLPPC